MKSFTAVGYVATVNTTGAILLRQNVATASAGTWTSVPTAVNLTGIIISVRRCFRWGRFKRRDTSAICPKCLKVS